MMNLVETSDGKEIIAPTVHLNGSGKKNLSDEFRAALAAISSAKDAVMRTSPHGRDFYTQNQPGAALFSEPFDRARAEHRARLDKLNEVSDELVTILMDVIDNG